MAATGATIKLGQDRRVVVKIFPIGGGESITGTVHEQTFFRCLQEEQFVEVWTGRTYHAEMVQVSSIFSYGIEGER